jgi:hypothetical protein
MKTANTRNMHTSSVCQPSVSAKLEAQDVIYERAVVLEASSLWDHGFDKTLLEAVDEALSSFGSSCKEAIYFHLAEDFNIGKNEIPDNIEEFAAAIEEIFGFGAKFIEIQIMKILHRETGCFCGYSPKHGELLFSEYVEAVRSSYTSHEAHNGCAEGVKATPFLYWKF